MKMYTLSTFYTRDWENQSGEVDADDKIHVQLKQEIH